jgi:hypothetical protein
VQFHPCLLGSYAVMWGRRLGIQALKEMPLVLVTWHELGDGRTGVGTPREVLRKVSTKIQNIWLRCIRSTCVWDMRTKAQIDVLRCVRSCLGYADESTNPRDASARVWDMRTKAQTQETSARVWDMRTKAQTHVSSGHTATVADVGLGLTSYHWQHGLDSSALGSSCRQNHGNINAPQRINLCARHTSNGILICLCFCQR